MQQRSDQASQPGTGGRANQRLRTRTAILRAASELMRDGRDVTMPEVARAALVSEATAYRYFPNLASLLREAMAGQWPTPAEALARVADVTDPVERVAAAAEHLARTVLVNQGAARAMIAATVTRPEDVPARPALRLGLIDHALAPVADTLDAAALEQLKRSLSVVISAEAVFTLTDLLRLDAQEAVAGVVRAATALTREALRPTS